jgi:hypothetical protein
MRPVLILPLSLLLVASLGGCSTARQAVGAVSNIGNIFGGTKSGGQDDQAAAQNSAATSGAASTIIRADDIKEASRGLPGGLVGDARHVLHSGDPVQPR